MSSRGDSTSRMETSTSGSEDEVIDLISESEDETVDDTKQQSLVSVEPTYSTDITKNGHIIKSLMSRVDLTGYNSTGEKVRRCVLSRFSDDTLRRLWECVKHNYTPVWTAEHINKQVSPCWIWKQIPGVAMFENEYPVLAYRKSLSKSVKLPFVKIHQLAVFIATGLRTGLGEGAATVTAPAGSRKKEWLLVSSHLCHTKGCISPFHLCAEANGWNADRGKCRGDECRCKGYLIGGKKCLLSYKD